MATDSARRGSVRVSQDVAAARLSVAGDEESHRPSHTETDLRQNIADTTLDPAHPRECGNGALTKQVYQQLLGLNPFKGSFLSLYRNLDSTSERCTAIVGALLAAAAGVPLPIMFVIFGQIINSFPPPEDELETRIGQLLGVAAAYFVITTIYMSAFGRVGEKIAINLREKLLRCLLNLDQAYYDTHDLDVTSLLTAKIETIQVGTSEKVGIFIQSLGYFVAAFIVGFILNAKLTGILLAAVIPAMVIVVATGSSWVSRLSKKLSTCTEQANGVLESALRSVKVVQAFDFEDKIAEQHSSHLRDSAVSGIRKAIVAASMLGLMYFVAYAANGLAFYVGSGMAEHGGAGTVYAVCLLILDASFVVGQFAPFLEMFARAASAGEEIRDLIGQSKQPSQIRMAEGEKSDIHGQEIAFEDVEFAYPARPTVKILRGLSLGFGAGTFNAIVGTSGGGKSTVVSLLTRIYGNYRGHIKIGNHELRNFDVDHLRSQVSVVEQDSILFSGTIYDNICHGLGQHDLSPQEQLQRCQEAVKAAAIDFIDNLPSGLNTTIGNNLQLSGGQKQRICLARALIKKPAILILDEPTSALDARSETMVAQTVKSVAATGTTVIMIAHRLSTVLDAQQIIVVSDGKVVEAGAPTALAKPGTIFNGLLEAQGTSTAWADRSTYEVITEKKEIDGEACAVSILSEESLEEQLAEKTPSGLELAHKILRLLKPDAPILLLGFAFSVVGGAIIIGEAIAFGNLIQLLNDNARGGSGLRSEIEFYCLIFFILSCVALVCYTGTGSSFGIASTRLTSRIQSALLRNTLRQDMAWFSAPGRSLHELMARINSDAGNLAALSGVVTGTLFAIATSMIGGLTLALVIAWRIAVVLMSCVPVLVTAGYLRLRILTKSEEHHRTAYNKAASIAAESCRNMRTIAILGLEDNVMHRYQKALEGPYKSGLRFTFASNALLAFSFAITYFVYALAYWWGSKNVREGYYDPVAFFIVLPALLFSAQGAGQAFSLTPEITRARSAAKNICMMLDMRPTILKLDDSQKPDDSTSMRSSADGELVRKKPANTTPKIHLENVTLRYKTDGSSPALRNVTLSVKEGENVALVGPSGAGKSSTIALLERFYDAAEGYVAVDGVNVCDMDARKLRSRISLVPQEPELFPGSIAHNVQLGAARHQDVSQEDVEDVCRRCGLHDFIISLPEGYTTDCASNGVTKLSGGQRQRLAIARAMIRNPEILLLDEPTSALDAHSERMVQESLGIASAGRTTITVAHRLASIQHMDRIIVFEMGTIVETGTHTELMEKGGLYASMAKAQSVA